MAVLLLLAGSMGVPQTRAQTEWRQRFQVTTPVQENSAVSALLDSIVHVARREDLALRRSPQDESARPIGQIEEALLSEGVDVTKPPIADLLANERHETAHQRDGV